MPFDGVVTKCAVIELDGLLTGGRVEKIFQPEADEILLNIRAKGQNLKLVLSAGASYPRIHVTEMSRENPAVPPVFCMLLRKHLTGGRITGIDFHDYERIIGLRIESTNELGDLTEKKLIIEIMGKHSNIMLLNHENKIIDSIKHIDNEISSVREVMPARPYVLPPSQNKTSPEELDVDLLLSSFTDSLQGSMSVEKLLLNTIKGFSPLLCREICHLAGIDGKQPAANLSQIGLVKLKEVLTELIGKLADCSFKPCIIFEDGKDQKPLDFHCLDIHQYGNVKYLDSISKVLDTFYSTKDKLERLKQKKSDLVKVIGNEIGRCNKKLAIQQEKLREVSDREKLKLFGELITANIYCIPRNTSQVSLLNYYSENDEHLDIILDENLTPQENAQRYFKQYTKAKSAFTYTSRQLEENLKELEYLESVSILLENCSTLQDIEEIRQELAEQSYVSDRRKGFSKRQSKPSKPLQFKSSDGLDIYVGKNNRQNDQLTMKQASSNDIWLHTRNIPGSHVIIKKQQDKVSDTALLEAAVLAAYHSKAKLSSNVPVDYTTVKNVKKTPGAKPGMVIYENFKTIVVTPDESIVNRLK